MRHLNYLTIIACFLLLSCSGQEQNSGTNEQVNIENASPKQLEGVKYGLKDKTLTIEKSCAVKSKDFEEVYFVGIKLSNGEIGVWSIGGSKTNTNFHFSVNDIAKKYSDYPQNTERASMRDHGAQEVYDHLASTENTDIKE
ncbi:hypothetical protein [Algoriphagus marincola]|uniref:hypothetical protein n=1 Tax=Algoriphagus marincola TaxID=264027 RepID=UPI00047AD090|nr:hypothetical protein [Algoriphagus marincola]